MPAVRREQLVREGTLRAGHHQLVVADERPSSLNARERRAPGDDRRASPMARRPGRGAHQAVLAAQRYIQAGKRVVVDVDLEKFLRSREPRRADGKAGEADRRTSGCCG